MGKAGKRKEMVKDLGGIRYVWKNKINVCIEGVANRGVLRPQRQADCMLFMDTLVWTKISTSYYREVIYGQIIK